MISWFAGSAEMQGLSGALENVPSYGGWGFHSLGMCGRDFGRAFILRTRSWITSFIGVLCARV
jgi:hypothetical protein